MISKNVREIINRLPSRDPFEITEFLNIKLFIVNLPQNIKGFYYCVYGVKFIYINQLLEKEEQQIVCAHELGHALLHPTINSFFMSSTSYFKEEKFELEANIFAANLLISDEIFSDEYQDSITLSGLSMELGIPEEFINLKFQSLYNN